MMNERNDDETLDVKLMKQEKNLAKMMFMGVPSFFTQTSLTLSSLNIKSIKKKQ
jgi:hypothetical protein